jgi:hypothetical protein
MRIILIHIFRVKTKTMNKSRRANLEEDKDMPGKGFLTNQKELAKFERLLPKK